MPITLALYNETYGHQLKEFHLPDDQLQFTSLPLDKINNPNISSDT
ncbi:hypothetical protein ABEW00_15960 [Rossellomorea vietnamensis]